MLVSYPYKSDRYGDFARVRKEIAGFHARLLLHSCAHPDHAPSACLRVSIPAFPGHPHPALVSGLPVCLRLHAPALCSGAVKFLCGDLSLDGGCRTDFHPDQFCPVSRLAVSLALSCRAFQCSLRHPLHHSVGGLLGPPLRHLPRNIAAETAVPDLSRTGSALTPGGLLLGRSQGEHTG